MTDTASFIVMGVPAPQGSKSAFVRGGRAVVVDGSSTSGRAKHKAWRQAVADAASDAAADVDGHGSFFGPTHVHVDFYLPAIKSAPYRWLHTTRPDLDKLIRSTLDGLVDGGLLADDSLVYALGVAKHYAAAGHWTGAHIVLEDDTQMEESNRALLRASARDARKAGGV